jgi:hypothetical protein
LIDELGVRESTPTTDDKARDVFFSGSVQRQEFAKPDTPRDVRLTYNRHGTQQFR